MWTPLRSSSATLFFSRISIKLNFSSSLCSYTFPELCLVFYQPRHPQQDHYLLQPQTCSTIHLTQQPLQSQEPHFHLPGLTLISSRFALVLGHQGRHAQCPHDQGQGQRCQCCRLTSVSSGIMLYNSVSSVSYLTQQIFSQGFIKISQEFPQIQYHRFPSYIITTCQLCFPGASIPDMQRNGREQ